MKNFDDFITTLEIFFDLIQKEQPGKPVFIVGHSMGGLISSYYLLDHQEQLAGAVISGGMAQVPEYVTPVTVAASKVLSVLAPRLGMVGVTAEHISQDKAVVDAYVNDPLVYTGKSTARLGAEMLKAMARVENEAAKIKLPILIVHGGEDKLVSPGDGQLLYDTVSSEDKTIKIYDGYYHEVFNEPGRDAVFADIEAWLKKHLK